MSISLSKEQSKVRLEKRTKEVSEIVKVNLTKHNLSPDTKARVAFVIDISGSMMHAYKKGYVQEIVEKIFPIAVNFDDNAEMDVWIFEDGYKRMPAMNKDNYAVTVNDIAHIIEAKTDNKFIRAFLVKDKPASDAAKAGYDFDKSLVLEQDESPEVNVKDSHISDIQTKSLDKYNVYAYSFDYMDIDTGLITQVYNYYIDLGDNIYANIVLNQTNKNKISDDEAFAVLSDFIFTT